MMSVGAVKRQRDVKQTVGWPKLIREFKKFFRKDAIIKRLEE